MYVCLAPSATNYESHQRAKNIASYGGGGHPYNMQGGSPFSSADADGTINKITVLFCGGLTVFRFLMIPLSVVHETVSPKLPVLLLNKE